MRPQTFDTYVGQEQAKKILLEMGLAAKNRGEPIKHLLFTGSAGLGKTSLAGVIAGYMGGKLITTTGMNLKKAEDVYKILVTLRPHDILYIDEIHELNAPEALYRALEDGLLELNVTSGKAQVTIQIRLPRFTLIGATTDPSQLPKPLRDRCVQIHLHPYSNEEMGRIVRNYLDTDTGVSEIVKRARATPRIAISLCDSIRDMAQNRGIEITDAVVAYAFETLGVDSLGLTDLDRKYLRTIIEKFDGGKVGIGTLAACMAEDEKSLIKNVEPYLLGQGLIDVLKGGRIAKESAYTHLGIKKESLI